MPVYNEAGNLKKLINEIVGEIEKISHEYEIIAVNDGSIDNSISVLRSEALKNNKLKIINFTRNFGQTAAINAGINDSSGDIIILIDSDLENDPKDILKLLNKMDEGYDVVSGWRKSRWKGKWLTRKLPSVIANWLISRISGVKLHDYGCTLKVYKKEVIKGVHFYGEMHRFIPIYAHWQGSGKITELEINYRQREYGESKYSLSRTFRVVLDLILIKFLDKYISRPMHFFGGIGFASFFIGVISGLAAVILRIFDIKHLVATPLPIFSALFIIVGAQLIAMGVIAEMVMRVYYESRNKAPYDIKEKINFK